MRPFLAAGGNQNLAMLRLTRWRVGLVLWYDQARWLHTGVNPKQRASEKAALESQFFEISPGTSPLVATTAPNGFLTQGLMFP